ncbi:MULTISPECIES: ABC transporter ATP-binding protein [unclassified Streptomyces]|uniref:ABC transporter ATP-binding protein n=1 Tax=unclassified Streptomyces TaxID=2593676 RepID=UPI00165530D4|nr:ABC transporter ATP-binding protein [Streptomyces sp. CB02980]MCB8904942.1 ABC transporter ATP-binding protein [Streptomyces sp. CB02980]
MSHPLLRATGIDVRFGGVHALRDVTVSVGPGEICGLIGPNGAGKTTLFDVVSGIRRPDAGTIAYDGTDITRRSPVWRARHGIRRTFQRQQLFGQLTVADNLVVAQDWRGGVRPAARRHRERAAAVLHECGLDALAGSYAGGLPVGQARMVELARALADPPRVLLLDEPASGTTAEERRRLAAVIRHMADEENCAVLLVEHNVAFVMEVCSRVVVLDLGRVLAEGSAAEIHADPAVREAYLGTGPGDAESGRPGR